jgi:lantibiotic transport system permease protein
MAFLLRAVQAELMKSKRTLGVWLCLLAPLMLAFLELVIGYQYGERFYKPGMNSWDRLFEHVTMMWALLLLPLFVTLQMGLLGAMEHNNHTLKQLYALPVPRWVYYVAKALVGYGLIGLSEIILVILTVLVGFIFQVIAPELNFDGAIPWEMMIKATLVCYLAAGLVTAFQFWVSMHWSSFVFSMGVGIVGTICGVLVMSSKWAEYYPWSMSGIAAINVVNKDPVGLGLYLGLIGGVVMLILGGIEVIRHDVV